MSVPITQGTGASSVAAEIISTLNYQQVKIVDGTASSTTPLKVNADGSITASIYGTITTTAGPASVSGTVGASVIGTVPVVQSGTVISSISGTVNASVSGIVGASIIGTVPVTGTFTTAFTQPASMVSGVSSIITNTTANTILPAPPAGQRNYITNVLVTNNAAVNSYVVITDNGSAQNIYAGYAAANGGGFSAAFPTALRQPASVAVISTSSNVQASLLVAISGYTAP